MAQNSPALNVCATERGTCNDPSCDLHGVCHCGCGAIPRVAAKTYTAKNHVRGMPAAFILGHAPKSRLTWSSTLKRPHPENAHRWEVPVARVMPILRFLVEVYGSQTKAAAAMGVGIRTFNRWMRNPTMKMRYGHAQTLAEMMKAMRHPPGEERRRLPTPAERQASQREAWRLEQQRLRGSRRRGDR